MASRPPALLVRAAGTNCEHETAHGWHLAGAEPRIVHLLELLEMPAMLDQARILTIPGGFSYGDDISAGRIFGAQLRRKLSARIRDFVDRGGLVLGICNGLQVLVAAGLLPDAELARHCTVTGNRVPGYQDRWVTLRASDDTRCVFLEPGRTYELPMGHGEGRIMFRSNGHLDAARQAGCLAIRYADVPAAVHAGSDTGQTAVDRAHGLHAGDSGVWLGNPNGSTDNLAGMCNPTGRVFGLMPHPDRFLDWTQHPAWSSLTQREPDGLAIFRRAVLALG